MITIEKIIKEEKKFIKNNKELPKTLLLTTNSFEELKQLLGYEPKMFHGMKILISNKNGIN